MRFRLASFLVALAFPACGPDGEEQDPPKQFEADFNEVLCEAAEGCELACDMPFVLDPLPSCTLEEFEEDNANACLSEVESMLPVDDCALVEQWLDNPPCYPFPQYCAQSPS